MAGILGLLRKFKTSVTRLDEEPISENKDYTLPDMTSQPINATDIVNPPKVPANQPLPLFRGKHGVKTGCDFQSRPKSGKVLRRKNTPALLPKVEKLHVAEKSASVSGICEEEEEEAEIKEENSKLEGAIGGAPL